MSPRLYVDSLKMEYILTYIKVPVSMYGTASPNRP